MLLFGKKEATWPPEDPQSNMVTKSLDSWRQSICPLRFQSPTVKDTKKGPQKWQGNQAANQAAKRAALQNNDLTGISTLVPKANLPEIPSYIPGETLKAKSGGFQEDHMIQKEGTPFSAWEPPMKVS